MGIPDDAEVLEFIKDMGAPADGTDLIDEDAIALLRGTPMSDDTQRPDERVREIITFLRIGLGPPKDSEDQRYTGVRIPDLRALMDAHDEQRARAERAEADVARLREAGQELADAIAGREVDPSLDPRGYGYVNTLRYNASNTMLAMAAERLDTAIAEMRALTAAADEGGDDE